MGKYAGHQGRITPTAINEIYYTLQAGLVSCVNVESYIIGSVISEGKRYGIPGGYGIKRNPVRDRLIE
jgi:hypothetical protein